MLQLRSSTAKLKKKKEWYQEIDPQRWDLGTGSVMALSEALEHLVNEQWDAGNLSHQVTSQLIKLFVVVVIQSCLTLRDPMDCSTPGFPVLHYLPEFAQTHVHWVVEAFQPSYPLLVPSSPAFSLPQIFTSGNEAMV